MADRFCFVAQLKLDETKWAIAYDSTGDKDGMLNGDTNWQPAAGKVGDSLKFDGTDNYISTVFVLNHISGWEIDEDSDGSDGWKTRWTSEFARGGYSLTARATDSGGIAVISPTVWIKVIPPW